MPGLAQIRDLRRQLGRARRTFAEPERDGRRLPVRVGDADDAALDLQNPPRGVAELEDVADVGFDGEILIERADERIVGVLTDLVVGDVGDRPAAGDGGDAGALARHDAAVHAVAMQQPAPTVGVHLDDAIEIGARNIAKRPSPSEGVEEIVLVPSLLTGGDAGGDDLLGEDVQRRRGLGRAIQIAALDGAHQRRRLDQLIDSQRKQPALGHFSDRMTRSSDALEEGRDRARGADLDRQIHFADVDAQLQGRGGDQRLEPA